MSMTTTRTLGTLALGSGEFLEPGFGPLRRDGAVTLETVEDALYERPMGAHESLEIDLQRDRWNAFLGYAAKAPPWAQPATR